MVHLFTILATTSWASMIFPLIFFASNTDLSTFWYIYGLTPIFALLLLGIFFLKYTKARSQTWYMTASAVLFSFALIIALIGQTFTIIFTNHLHQNGHLLLLLSTYIVFIALVLALLAYSGLPRVDVA
jgi:peptidoglycan/LPS O-acetylase OafA/YrhL